MHLNKGVSTRIAFGIVLLWFILSLGLIYWQSGSVKEQFKKNNFINQQVLD